MILDLGTLCIKKVSVLEGTIANIHYRSFRTDQMCVPTSWKDNSGNNLVKDFGRKNQDALKNNLFLQKSFRAYDPFWCKFVYACSNPLACCSKAFVNLPSADCKTRSWCKSTFSCSSPQYKKYDVFLLSAITGARSVKNYVHLPQQCSSSQEHKGQILYHQTQAAYMSHQMIAKAHECMKLEQLAAYSENCALGPSHWRGLHWHVVQNPRAEGHGSRLWSSDL